jgi:hypothetical protein
MTIDELERLHREATPGPWEQHKIASLSVIGPEPDDYVVAACGSYSTTLRDMTSIQTANSLLIAASRNAVPDFIAVLRLLARVRPTLGTTMADEDERIALLAKWGVS